MRTFNMANLLARAIGTVLISAGMMGAAPLAYSAGPGSQDTTAGSSSTFVPPSLFSPYVSGAAADSAFKRDLQVVRSQAVSIDRQLLTGMFDIPAAVSSQSHPITLNLFDDVSFVADMDQLTRQAGGVTWTGTLRGVEHSSVVIVANGNVVAGNISMPEARYHIRFIGNGVHEVQKIDTSLFPEDESSVPVPKAGTGQDSIPARDPGVQADDGTIIDVMVAYSATTRAAAGGTSAIQSQIALGIAETNQAYQNSGVTQRLRLVHSVEVAYAETGPDTLGNALNCITSTSDGCLDEIHTLRNTYGADLVSFWIENGGGYCGLGWLMNGSPTLGFSAVARSCATGYYSFGHELGHTMGLRHDTYVDATATPRTYQHGFTFPSALSPWRTIMAYNDACAAVSKNCTRIQYFSNPDITYGGASMGNASTADNHRVLNETAFTVANFRASVAVPCTYVLSAASQSVSAAAAGGGVNVTVSSGCAWTAVSNAGWIVVTSGASGNGNGSVAFTIAANTGAAARTGTLTIAGQTFTVTQGFEDGFPNGANLPAGWVQGPGSNAAWAITTGTAFGGGSSIRSGAITDGQSSTIQVGGNYKAGTVGFALKVDSQANADYLRFYIDGALQASWSGVVNWNFVSYPVAAGQHTFKWEYKKDPSSATGTDAAWIDDVTLPPKKSTGEVNLMLLLD